MQDLTTRTPDKRSSGDWNRREFIRLSALGTALAAFNPWPAVAGPFTRADFDKLVPADKKLSPNWVKSLFERGQRAVYRGPELDKIGMPIGGLCAGQVYLGGDGKLWHWDIFNKHVGTGAEHYANPMTPKSPLEQGFALQVTAGGRTQVRPLDRAGWREITFNGEYPLASIEYRDPESPVSVALEAFSPFIPLSTDDSSLPATVMRFTVKNTSQTKADVELAGWLENAVCLHTGQTREILHRNRVVKRGGLTFLECGAEVMPEDKAAPKRPDILFDDFERATYGDWAATGAAFGKGPIAQKEVPEYQGNLGFHGQRGVNSHASAPPGDVSGKDASTGTLTSKPFTIERNFISFLIGGGPHKGKTCVNLLVDDKPALSATGAGDNRMKPHSWDVRKWAGKIAKLQVVDNETGAWGNISIDYILFTDQPRGPVGPLSEETDYGTMGLALLNADKGEPVAEAKPAHDETPYKNGISSELSPAPFPLTPALSLGERESASATLEESASLEFNGRGQSVSPLPLGGEGQGEGVRISEPAKHPSEFEIAVGGAITSDVANAGLPDEKVPAGLFSAAPGAASDTASKPFGQKLLGSLARKFSLAAGESATVTFLVTWHFANLKMDRLPPGRYYGTRFKSALEVAEYLAKNFDSLRRQTHLWHDTWYDSTLPYWFLDRTFLNASILATSTSFRFGNGRFWGWEGVGCCHGTCGHVWQYAQAMGRLFPDLERDTRERVDFGLALKADGAIHFRGEFNNIPAVDAQAGTVLRALREHQVSASDAWLKQNWSGIKKSIEWLIAKDGDGDGLITGNQHNTLDTDWFGPVAWLSGMYLAALRAGEEMAREVGDSAFATRCREIFDQGQPKLVAELFDGEYFINKPDPKRPETINSGTGCHIDQVFGQGWAFQVGLGRILPEKETVAALKSLWRYNFTPDVGPYRDANKPGRWYAMPGEGGLLMCTFPRTDWDYAKAKGKGADWAAGYFNECMNGFEYQAAWHMVAEGLVMEGLAITRMIHDRYHPLRRNPWNEIECGDHYARSMASHGIFLTACGFEYHGPKGHIGFVPKLTPENFKCPFTAAEGWGTFSQKLDATSAKCELAVKWGTLRLNSLALSVNGTPARAVVTAAGKAVPATLTLNGKRAEIKLGREIRLKAEDTLTVTLA